MSSEDQSLLCNTTQMTNWKQEENMLTVQVKQEPPDECEDFSSMEHVKLETIPSQHLGDNVEEMEHIPSHHLGVEQLEHNPSQQVYNAEVSDIPVKTEPLEAIFIPDYGTLSIKLEPEEFSMEHQTAESKDVQPPLKLAECQVLLTKILECDSCSFYTDCKSILATHKQTHLAPSISVKTELTMSESSTNVQGKTVFNQKCPHCDKAYALPEALTWHIEYCHGTDPLVKIIKLGNNQYRFQCVFCKSVFSNQLSILDHLRLKHLLKRLPFPCKKCGKQFPTTSDLKAHENRCHRHKPNFQLSNVIECRLCNEFFVSKQKCKTHISKVHSNTKFDCRYCGLSFKFYKRLLLHCRIDHSRNSAPCEFCDVEFDSYSTYMKHRMFVHEGIIFTCTFCPAKFPTTNLVAKHVQEVHCLYIKPISCKFCDSKFKDNHNLEQHVRCYHSDEVLQCAHCKFKTYSKRYLCTHLQSKHIKTGKS